MTIQGINTTAGTLTYSYENITIGPGATVTIPSSVLASFAKNPQVSADITNGFLNLTDTVNTYKGFYASQLLETVPSEKPTYSATNTFVAATTPTDIFTITGSATRTIQILKIGISASATTATIANLTLLKRSTADTAGTSTTLTNTSLDSTNAAATATVRSYTANPTLGTLIGNIKNVKFIMPPTIVGGQASAQQQLIMNFGDTDGGQTITVRGTNEVVAINLNSTTLTGNTFSVWIEWTEK